jgi:ABC-type multidrug transport system ATPase subunit
MDVNTSAKSIKRRIGVQLQSTSLLPDLTVFEQVQLFAMLYVAWIASDGSPNRSIVLG